MFRIERLRYEDLGRCAELERVIFGGDDPWSEAMFMAELNAGYYYLGAFVDGVGLVGYAGMSLIGLGRYPEASVHNVGVDPAWQGRGIGRGLVKSLLAKADEVDAPVFLEVRTDNAAAIGLYASLGFNRIGLRRRYYQPSGADAYTMARPATVSEEMP
jgi:ribosomal-protein-alanine N-acetyltransferase